jgi:hypothetical protein
LIAALSACAQAPVAEKAPDTERAQLVELAHPRTGAEELSAYLADGRCQIGVSFASIGMGISNRAFDIALEVLSAAPDAHTVYVQPWGREGERTLCTAIDHRALADVRAELKNRLAPYLKNENYPVTLLPEAPE